MTEAHRARSVMHTLTRQSGREGRRVLRDFCQAGGCLAYDCDRQRQDSPRPQAASAERVADGVARKGAAVDRRYLANQIGPGKELFAQFCSQPRTLGQRESAIDGHEVFCQRLIEPGAIKSPHAFHDEQVVRARAKVRRDEMTDRATRIVRRDG